MVTKQQELHAGALHSLQLGYISMWKIPTMYLGNIEGNSKHKDENTDMTV